MSFRLARKIPGMDSIIKDLAEKQQRARAEEGMEDLSLFRQNRVDTDSAIFTDIGSELLDGDRLDADSLAIVDSDAILMETAGQYRVDGDFFCGSGAIINETDKPAGAFAGGTGNFDEPDQPAVSDHCDAG